jgi:type I restriction enzyme S subunit
MSFRNGLNFKQADVGEAIKIVGVGDFQARSTLVDTSELATISVSGSVRETDLLQDGDLLFVRSNGNKALIGRCLYFPSVKERLSFSGFTIRGRIDSTKVLPEFSSYLVRADHVTAQFFQGGSGTNISNLSQEILSDVCVTIPRPLEQERISKLLLTWDKAISATEKLLANSRRQKQALMWGLLSGKRRFVSPAGSWQYVDFDRVFERITRKNSICNDNVLTISGQHGLIGQRDYFNKSVASDNLSGYTLLEWGDFAYNKSYSAGYPMGAIKPLLAYDAGVVSSLYLCFRLRANVDADLDFFRHYFEAGLLNEEISGIAQEGARNHGLLNVSVTDFFKLRLHIPPAPVQRKIAEAINVAEAEERWFEQELIRFQTEKRALMQQLLTGKRRVRLPATEAASV